MERCLLFDFTLLSTMYQVQCSDGAPVLRLTSQTSQNYKILQTDWPRVFCSISQNSMIFFVASMEA